MSAVSHKCVAVFARSRLYALPRRDQDLSHLSNASSALPRRIRGGESVNTVARRSLVRREGWGIPEVPIGINPMVSSAMEWHEKLFDDRPALAGRECDRIGRAFEWEEHACVW